MDRPSLLLTRPRASAERFAATLDPSVLGVTPVCISPLIEIVPRANTLDLDDFGGVVFSSANGVAFGPDGNGRSAFCVGAQTAQAAADRNWVVQAVGQTADELVATFPGKDVPGPLAHLAGAHRRGEIAARLKAIGISVEVFTLYDQSLLPLSKQAQQLLLGEVPVIVPLFSPRTAVQFAKEACDMRRAIIVAISRAVENALQGCEVAQMEVVRAPIRGEMQRKVEMLLRNVSST